MTSRALPGAHRAVRAARAPRSRRLASYRAGLYAMLAPYLLGALLLVAVPALLTVALAFTEYDALAPPLWRGLWNFNELRRNELVSVAAFNSLLYIALAVPLRLLAALALALLLHGRRRATGLYRAAIYLPTVIPDVAYALIWLWLFNPLYGPINIVLRGLGLPAPIWLAEPTSARLAIVIMALFQIGEGFVVLLAGLQEVPRDYYDAAAVDGAGAWTAFRRITLPLLAPWLVLLTLRDMIMSTQSTFTPAYLMTGGDPYYATLFLPLLIYEESFEGLRFGVGAALMLAMLAGLALLLFLVYRLVGGWGYGDDH
jgi:multiple sugar transport system permease protein